MAGSDRGQSIRCREWREPRTRHQEQPRKPQHTLGKVRPGVERKEAKVLIVASLFNSRFCVL